MAETLPAEEVLLPAPSACRSDRAAVAHLPLRLAVYAPEKDVPVAVSYTHLDVYKRQL